jgi:alkylation response protein AidB-like acyl-CoA dehydrogenase
LDLNFTPGHEAFRETARRFFQSDYPHSILAKIQSGQTLTNADLIESERALNAVGWLAPNWPREYGGTGWSATERYIFDDELERAGAPSVSPMGLLYAAPVIYTFGRPEQKARWLPDILSGRTFWAQGYSEPGAGSDLASLTTRAERVGDKYVVNGVKTWTSQAHYADWIFCLVRTSQEARKQDGITFLCIDMKTPGVTVRPITTIDGLHHLNEVTFVDVETSLDNRVGEEGRGWSHARYLLTHERTSYAHVAGKKRQVAQLKELARGASWGDAVSEEGRAFFRRLAEVEVALTALEYTTLRALAPLESGQAPGDESSIIKILATENAQAITELFVDLAGPFAVPFVADREHETWRTGLETVPLFAIPATAAYFFARAQTIYGGATEIQKNIIFRTIAA